MSRKVIAAALSLLVTLVIDTGRKTAPAMVVPAEDRHDLAPAAEPTTDGVILVALDGVRWQEVFSGIDPSLWPKGTPLPEAGARSLFPRLYALMESRGAALGSPGSSATMRASGPNYVSLPGYTEMLTGRASPCRNNDCPRTTHASFPDVVANRGQSAAVFSSWERIERVVATESPHLIVSAGRHGGTDLASSPRAADLALRYRDTRAFPGEDDFRRDRFTKEIALAHWADAHPTFMFLGFGEPDEFAHKMDYPGYVGSLRELDRAIGELFDLIDRAGEFGKKTTVFITADHGRAHDFKSHGDFAPESGRTWLVALGAGIEARGLLTKHPERRLRDIIPTARTLLGLPPQLAYDETGARAEGHSISELLLPFPGSSTETFATVTRN
jgi:hypothetical protein